MTDTAHEHQWQDTGFADLDDCAVKGCDMVRSPSGRFIERPALYPRRGPETAMTDSALVVWVVLRCIPYEGCTFEGVFSTKELAQAFIDQADDWEQMDMEVHGCVMDDPKAEVA